MLSCLEQIKTALLTVSENFGHYEAVDTSQPYGVWAEDSEFSALDVDNYKAGQVIEGAIDWFSKNENDPAFAAIPQALIDAGVGWSRNSVQYEDETGYIHYEWLFRVRESWQK